MHLRYVDNTCQIEISVSDVLDADGMCIRGVHLPVADADAFIEGTVPVEVGQPFAISEFQEDSHIIGADFNRLEDMRLTFGRLSFYIEMSGKKEIPSVSECIEEACPAAVGHDIRTSDMAEFFSIQRSTGSPLLPGEQQLLSALISTGHLIDDGASYQPACEEHAVIAMSRDVSVEDRLDTFTHEYSHALYFTNSEFSRSVSTAWQNFSEKDRQFIESALEVFIYYSGSPWLMETEAAAYSISNPLYKDGLLHIIASAYMECADKRDADPCRELDTYDVDIRDLLLSMYDAFMQISKDKIPLLAAPLPHDELERDANRKVDAYNDAAMRKSSETGIEVPPMPSPDLLLKLIQLRRAYHHSGL